MKKILIIMMVFLLFVLVGCSNDNNGSDSELYGNDNPDKVTIYYFWGDGCPHCAEQKPFLDELEEKYSEIEIKRFETWGSPENARFFQRVALAYGTEARGVPATFIGDEFWVGYSDSMKSAMEDQVIYCIENSCENPGDKLMGYN